MVYTLYIFIGIARIVKLLLLSIHNVKLCHDMHTDIDMKEMVMLDI